MNYLWKYYVKKKYKEKRLYNIVRDYIRKDN